jgi:hypothetical protein
MAQAIAALGRADRRGPEPAERCDGLPMSQIDGKLSINVEPTKNVDAADNWWLSNNRQGYNRWLKK